jgi:hypothetical protein
VTRRRHVHVQLSFGDIDADEVIDDAIGGACLSMGPRACICGIVVRPRWLFGVLEDFADGGLHLITGSGALNPSRLPAAPAPQLTPRERFW